MPSEAILLEVLALALLVLLVLRLHVVYVWYRIHWANRRVLDGSNDKRKHQISCQDGWCRLEGSESNRRKEDRRVKK